MGRNAWLNSITRQIQEYKNNEETNLIVLRDHLQKLISDIEEDPKFEIQLKKYLSK